MTLRFREGMEEWTYTELDAAVAQVRTAVCHKYNREHPGEPLRHEDGRYEGDEVGDALIDDV